MKICEVAEWRSCTLDFSSGYGFRAEVGVREHESVLLEKQIISHTSRARRGLVCRALIQ